MSLKPTHEGYRHREEVAHSHRHQVLQDHDERILMVLFGILAYSALSHLVGDAIYFVEGGRSLLEFGCSLGLGVLYGMTARRVWFDSNTPWWIIVAPAVLSLMISCVHSPSGMTLTVPLALSVILLITTLIRIKLHQALVSVLQDD